MNPLYDLHIEVGTDSGGTAYYARVSLGTGAFEIKRVEQTTHECLINLIDEMDTYAVFTSLNKNPLLTKYPIPPSALSSHDQKQYDLHIECGGVPTFSKTQHFYARTQFLGTTEYHTDAPSIKLAIKALMIELYYTNMVEPLWKTPTISIYPIPFTDIVEASMSTPKAKEVKRSLPSENTRVSHPACQDICTSFDHFNTSHCASICSWRKEV